MNHAFNEWIMDHPGLITIAFWAFVAHAIVFYVVGFYHSIEWLRDELWDLRHRTGRWYNNGGWR